MEQDGRAPNDPPLIGCPGGGKRVETATGTVHVVWPAEDLAALGKIMDSIFADPEILAIMQSTADTTSWTSSILGDLPMP